MAQKNSITLTHDNAYVLMIAMSDLADGTYGNPEYKLTDDALREKGFSRVLLPGAMK